MEGMVKLFTFHFWVSLQALAEPQQDSSDKPDILVIWADDIGWPNFSVYHRGVMGGVRQTLIVLLKKVLCSLIIMPSRVVRLVGQHLLQASIRIESAC